MSFNARFLYDDMATAPPPTFNIAEIMAKQGAKIDADDFTTAVPDIKIEEKKPEPTPAPVVETTPAPVKEEIKAEPITVTPTPPPVQQQPVAAVETDWKENIKKADTTEVLKELGYDDFAIGALDYYKKTGNLAPYLEVKTVDFTKMSPEDLMRRQLSSEHPELSPEDFEEYYRMKVTEAYKLDPELFSETDVKRGKILLSADVKKYRDQVIAEQKGFKAPEPQPDIEVQKKEEAAKQAFENYKNVLTNDPISKELMTTKKIKIGEGDEAFLYEIAEPEKIMTALTDYNEYAKLVYNSDGSPNVRKQLLLSLIANDDVGFLKELGKHYKALGGKAAIEPIENAKKPEGTPASDGKPITPAQALAKSGTLSVHS